MRKARVFLSYARNDQPTVLRLYQKLSKAGFDPWMDKKNLLAGETWEPSIDRTINGSDFFLLCLTKRAVKKRGFLQKEIRIAISIQEKLLDEDFFLIPVKLEQCTVPRQLKKWNWVALFKPDGWENLLEALNREIKRRLRNVATASPITESTRNRIPTQVRMGYAVLSRRTSSPSAKAASTLKQTRQLSESARHITEARLPSPWLPDLDLFRRTINRTRIVNDPQRHVFAPTKHRRSDQIKIATVSMGGDFSDFTGRLKDDYRIWVVGDFRRRKQLRKEFLRHLKTAANAGAKLICFNQLAYPTPLDAKGEKPFKNQINKLVAEHELSLIAGSYYHPQRFYNLCPVVATDDRGQVHTILHAKMTNVIRGFESNRIPPNSHLRYYGTANGVFAILPGNDVYDPSLILRLIMKNHLYSTEEKVDFVFVPSFTATDAKALVQACRDLSYAMASVVVYVNCVGLPRHTAFLAGEELVRNNRRVRCEAKSISDNVMLYTLSYEEYQRVRDKVSDSYSPITDYLIGQKDGISVDIKL